MDKFRAKFDGDRQPRPPSRQDTTTHPITRLKQCDLCSGPSQATGRGQPRHSGADYNDIGLNHKEMDAIVSRIDCQFQTAPWFRIRSVSAFGNEEAPRSAAGSDEVKVANEWEDAKNLCC